MWFAIKIDVFAPIVSLLRFLCWFFSFIRCYFPLLIHSCSYLTDNPAVSRLCNIFFMLSLPHYCSYFRKKKNPHSSVLWKMQQQKLEVCVRFNKYVYVNGCQPLSWKNFMCFISKIYVYVWHNNCITSDWKRKETKKMKEKKNPP